MSFSDYHLKEVNVRLVLNESAGLYSSTPIRTPQDAIDVLADAMRELDREMVCVINMDTKLRAISYNISSIGNLSSSVVEISNVFKTAILTNAAGILAVSSASETSRNPAVSYVVLAHNHP